jgi:hypothetical protein
MNCGDFILRLADSGSPTGAMRDHCDACEVCRPLLDVDHALRLESPQPPPPMSAELRDALAAHRRVRVPYTAPRRALAPAGVVVAVLGLVALAAPRPDLARVPDWVVLTCGLGFLGAFAAGIALVLVRDRAGRAAGAAMRYAFLAAVAIAYVALTALAAESVPGPQSRRSIQDWLAANVIPVVGGWARHLPCTIIGLVLGTAVAAAILRAAIRTATASPGLSGAVSGAAASMATAFILFTYCPSHAIFHATLVHAIPLAIIVSGSAGLGRRLLAS